MCPCLEIMNPLATTARTDDFDLDSSQQRLNKPQSSPLWASGLEGGIHVCSHTLPSSASEIGINEHYASFGQFSAV